jgi:hypothetical protein
VRSKSEQVKCFAMTIVLICLIPFAWILDVYDRLRGVDPGYRWTEHD